MNASLGHWIAALTVSSGVLAMPVGAIRPEPDLPLGRICHAQFETNATGVFHGVGVVKEIQAGTGALTLDHEDIVGLMPAMEMMYRVKAPEISHGLKVGDRVDFEVDGKTYVILSVKLIAP